MAKITLANGAVFEGTAQECATFAGMAQSTKPSSTKKTKGKGTKAQPKVEKQVTTRTEAIAAWKSERNITDTTKAKYKSIYDAKWAKDWAKWADSADAKALTGAARKAANQAKAKEIRNGYRKQAGMNEKSFEK